MPTHAAPRSSSPRGAVPLSRSGWRRVRQTLTVGVFVTATVAGVTIGLGGATVSPVSPAAAVVAPVTDAASTEARVARTPTMDEGPVTDGTARRGHGRHR